MSQRWTDFLVRKSQLNKILIYNYTLAFQIATTWIFPRGWLGQHKCLWFGRHYDIILIWLNYSPNANIYPTILVIFLLPTWRLNETAQQNVYLSAILIKVVFKLTLRGKNMHSRPYPILFTWALKWTNISPSS